MFYSRKQAGTASLIVLSGQLVGWEGGREGVVIITDNTGTPVSSGAWCVRNISLVIRGDRTPNIIITTQHNTV